ncbi:tetratricopeptide repeat protein [Streptomyces sp. NPDC056527]|uniref:tetratricopeptide repeat protein n=1 Tax=Streptomyces sp. NPDC056527 TaxID=3345853 RepID=UPI0036BB79A5
MSQRRPSRQELNRAHRRTGFIGRHEERQSFHANLCLDPGEADYLFHVFGVAGVGKSSLIRHWEGTARAAGAVTAVVNEDANSPIEAMESISAQLARQGQALSRFATTVERYHKQRHEADAALALPAVDCGDGTVSTASRTAAQIGMGALSLAPVIGPAAAALDVDQLARGADRMRAVVSSRFRNHHDAELVLDPLRVLTPAFVQGLAEAADRHSWVVLFFDTWERTEPFLDAWLRSVVLDDDHGDLPLNVVVVISGQAAPVAREWAAHERSDELDPDYPWAVANRGVVHRLAGRYEQAITDLDHAIRLNPRYAWAIANRGAARRRAGHHGAARGDIEQALGMEPANTEYQLQRAMLITTVDGFRDAAGIWRSIGAGDPRDEYGALAVFLAALSTGTEDEANRVFRRFMACNPHCDTLVEATQCLHELAALLGLDREGIDRYRSALANRLIEMRT